MTGKDIVNGDVTVISELNIPMISVSRQFLSAAATPLLALLSERRDEIIKYLHQYGAVLFRGFRCQDVNYFSQAIELCNLGQRGSTRDYDLARTILAHDIYTSSDLAADIVLPLHHEKPRSRNPPNHIYFCCVTAPEEGGGTLFANARAIWDDMPKSIQDKIIAHGVLYRQFFHGELLKPYVLNKILNNRSARKWMEYFGTDEKIKIEERLVQNGVHWKWSNHGKDLVVINPLPGALQHPVTQQTVWFNSAAYLNYYHNALYGELNALPCGRYLAARYLISKDMFPMVCHYGNGQAFSSHEIAIIAQIMQRHTSALYWQEGDFMIVDNFTFMHGKQAHRGHRLLYSCMTHASDSI